MDYPNLALIGFMASGKSTIGAALAARLEYPLIDLDQRIVEAAGCAIPSIFAAEGEVGFRAREAAAAYEAAAEPRWIIACGGGIVHNAAALAHLAARGRVVWLRLGEEVLARRIVADGPGRPVIDDHVEALTLTAVRRRVRELLDQRRPLYEAAGGLAVDLDGLDVPAAAEAILARLAAEACS